MNFKIRFLGILIVTCIAANVYSAELFSVDFENELKAFGAEPAEPKGAAGIGYEVVKESAEMLSVSLTDKFAAQGRYSLQVGGNIEWHIGQSDIAGGQLSFWFMPIVLPPSGQSVEIVWGGDSSKPHQTFTMKLSDDGKISVNYWSWQKQDWLKGLNGSISLDKRKWNAIVFTFGQNGQRLFVNGKIADRNDENFPISWLLDLRFGGLAMCIDDIKLSSEEQPSTYVASDKKWIAATELQDKLVKIEKDVEVLISKAPKNSDAWCRGLIIKYAAELAWSGVLANNIGNLTVDNIEWMENALAQTKPELRKGEIPVPPFDANKQIVIKDGMILQDGKPTFLLGNYSLTPIDSNVGFTLANALMPGPYNALPSPETIGDKGNQLVETIKNTNKANKAIDVLLSASGAEWIVQMDSTVFESGAGWFNYNVESPAVMASFASAIDVVLPTIKNCGTNVFVNLANEPAYSGYSPTTTGPRWRLWLMAKHGSIQALNGSWGTSYKNFLEVNGPSVIESKAVGCADPGGFDVPTDPNVLGQWYDWCIFNQERYGNFLTFLRDNMRKHRSDLLFNVKWLSNFSGWWKSIGYALNPYYVTKLSDFGGTDAWTIYAGVDPNNYWGVWWDDFARSYDLLKSISPEKPVINSENHLLRGYDPTAPAFKYGTYWDVIPRQFFYTAVWQQGIHGGAAGEFWTYWEAGKGYNLNERAKAFDATSQAARDLRRYAEEVMSIANNKPKIGVVLSSAALAWNPKEHIESVKLAYKAMNLTGLHIGFMLEEMLEDEALSRYEIIVIPNAVHISRQLHEALQEFIAGGKKVIVIGDMPQKDEYNKPLNRLPYLVWEDIKPVIIETAKAFDALRPDSLGGDDEIARKLQLRFWDYLISVNMQPSLTIEKDGKIPYGIEWRGTLINKNYFVNVCNLTNHMQEIEIKYNGSTANALNLLDADKIKGKISLEPLEVVLLKIK
jgi:hypothetical protein